MNIFKWYRGAGTHMIGEQVFIYLCSAQLASSFWNSNLNFKIILQSMNTNIHCVTELYTNPFFPKFDGLLFILLIPTAWILLYSDCQLANAAYFMLSFQ